MSSAELRSLDLDSLADGIPVLTDVAAAFYKQNCMVCLDSQGHGSGVQLESEYESSEQFEVRWDGEVTEQMMRVYRDEAKATDFGAYALALLLVRTLTAYTAIEQSNTGTTIDYYLTYKEAQDDTLIFNNAAYLEVSGIRQETESNTVAKRIAEKKRRLNTEDDLPALIAVIEFSRPWSKMVEV